MTGPARPGPVRAFVNGELREVAPGTTLADLVALLCPSGRGVAVAVDREVVPRSRWGHQTVGDGARVEVVTAAAGG
ncbi:MAG: sulfur carrier protein ThiS [Acidimicrobiales bacterium]